MLHLPDIKRPACQVCRQNTTAQNLSLTPHNHKQKDSLSLTCNKEEPSRRSASTPGCSLRGARYGTRDPHFNHWGQRPKAKMLRYLSTAPGKEMATPLSPPVAKSSRARRSWLKVQWRNLNNRRSADFADATALGHPTSLYPITLPSSPFSKYFSCQPSTWHVWRPRSRQQP